MDGTQEGTAAQSWACIPEPPDPAGGGDNNPTVGIGVERDGDCATGVEGQRNGEAHDGESRALLRPQWAVEGRGMIRERTRVAGARGSAGSVGRAAEEKRRKRQMSRERFRKP